MERQIEKWIEEVLSCNYGADFTVEVQRKRKVERLEAKNEVRNENKTRS